MLTHIRNVPWEFADIIPDYLPGRSTAVLFLSVQYHLIHPEYVYGRFRDLGKAFRLRVLLLLVDVTDPQKSITELCHAGIVREYGY